MAVRLDRQQRGALRGSRAAAASYYGDTWLYGSTGWTQAAPSHYPGPRAGEGLAFDPVLGHVVLGGGYDSTLTYDDQWLWDGTDWEQGDAPDYPGWCSHAMFVTAAGTGRSSPGAVTISPAGIGFRMDHGLGTARHAEEATPSKRTP